MDIWLWAISYKLRLILKPHWLKWVSWGLLRAISWQRYSLTLVWIPLVLWCGRYEFATSRPNHGMLLFVTWYLKLKTIRGKVWLQAVMMQYHWQLKVVCCCHLEYINQSWHRNLLSYLLSDLMMCICVLYQRP